MRWILPADIDHKLSILENVLRRRGVTADAQDKFLSPTWEQLYDFQELHGVELAAAEVISAVQQKQKIFIHGDYDVDGVCATALLWEFLFREMNADVLPYIPNRFDEGYGLSTSSVDNIISQGGQLIITVDCGVKDVDKVRDYVGKGLRFIITDHHALPTDGEGNALLSEEALAIVHPRHPQQLYPFPDICGAAVAWKLAQAIAHRAGLDVDMRKYLDLVALATVCDVMPLIDENRVLVALGLTELQSGSRMGVRALAEVAALKLPDLQAYNLGFTLGPRLNAAGRMESALDALRLLTTRSMPQAQELAAKLQSLNLQRQQLTQDLIAKAELQLAAQENQRVVFVHGDEWPEGIIGLVAGKLAERLRKPVFVGSTRDGQIKASARSPQGFHLANALRQLEHLLERHGGHAQAAGLTLAVGNLDTFVATIDELAATALGEEVVEPELEVDAVLGLIDLNQSLASELERLAPFGFGNMKPVVMVSNLVLTDRKQLGKENQHIKFRFKDPQGNGIWALDFGGAAKWADLRVGDRVDVVGNLNLNTWNGTTEVQLVVKDIKKLGS